MNEIEETEKMKPAAAAEASVGNARRWWQRYCGPQAPDRGARARLRRCRSTTEAMQEQAAIALAQWTGQIPPGTLLPTKRALAAIDLARVLAHVKQDDPGRPLMRAAGWKSFPGDRKESDVESDLRPVLSEIRFRRLLTCESGEPLVRAFVRLIALLDHSVDVEALRRDFMDWGEPARREALRQRWAYDYYAASSAHPSSSAQLPATEANAS